MYYFIIMLISKGSRNKGPAIKEKVTFFGTFKKKHRRISQIRMLYQNFKNKSYYLNFKRNNKSYMPL